MIALLIKPNAQVHLEVAHGLALPEQRRSLPDGARQPLQRLEHRMLHQLLLRLAQRQRQPFHGELAEEARRVAPVEGIRQKEDLPRHAQGLARRTEHAQLLCREELLEQRCHHTSRAGCVALIEHEKPLPVLQRAPHVGHRRELHVERLGERPKHAAFGLAALELDAHAPLGEPAPLEQVRGGREREGRLAYPRRPVQRDEAHLLLAPLPELEHELLQRDGTPQKGLVHIGRLELGQRVALDDSAVRERREERHAMRVHISLCGDTPLPPSVAVGKPSVAVAEASRRLWRLVPLGQQHELLRFFGWIG